MLLHFTDSASFFFIPHNNPLSEVYRELLGTKILWKIIYLKSIIYLFLVSLCRLFFSFFFTLFLNNIRNTLVFFIQGFLYLFLFLKTQTSNMLWLSKPRRRNCCAHDPRISVWRSLRLPRLRLRPQKSMVGCLMEPGPAPLAGKQGPVWPHSLCL